MVTFGGRAAGLGPGEGPRCQGMDRWATIRGEGGEDKGAEGFEEDAAAARGEEALWARRGLRTAEGRSPRETAATCGSRRAGSALSKEEEEKKGREGEVREMGRRKLVSLALSPLEEIIQTIDNDAQTHFLKSRGVQDDPLGHKLGI